MSEEINKDLFITSLCTDLNKELDLEELQALQEQLIQNLKNYSISIEEDYSENKEEWLEQRNKAIETFKMAKLMEGRSAKSVNLYLMVIRKFFKYCDKPIEKVTSLDIRAFLIKIQKEDKNTSTTADNNRSCLQSFFNWLTGEGILASNPTANVNPIKHEKTRREPLTDDEMVLVRESCKNARERALIEFLFSTGARVSEAATCKLSDVDLNSHEVYILGKGNKHRKVYLSATATYYLKKYLDTRDDKTDAVFVTLRSPHNPLGVGGMEKDIKELGIRAKLKNPLTPHILRHTCATHALSTGVDITEIQKMLGHSDISTTMVYSKVMEDDVKNHHQKSFT